MKRELVLIAAGMLLIALAIRQPQVVATQVAADRPDLAGELNIGEWVSLSEHAGGMSDVAVEHPASRKPFAEYMAERTEHFDKLNALNRRYLELVPKRRGARLEIINGVVVEKEPDAEPEPATLAHRQALAASVEKLQAEADAKFPEGPKPLFEVTKIGRDFIRLSDGLGKTRSFPFTSISDITRTVKQ